MRYLGIFFGLTVFSLLGLTKVQAQTFDLGFFSNQENNSLDQEIELKIGESSYVLTPQETYKWIEKKEDLIYNPAYDSEIENINFCDYKKSIACELTLSTRERNHIQKVLQIKLKEEPIKKFLEDLSRQYNKDPENAKLKIEDGRVSVFSLSKEGIAIKEEESLEKIKDFFSRRNQGDSASIEIPVQEIAPEIPTDSIDNLGITELVGEGTSNFVGSPKNRIHNIYVSTSRFEGLLIKPGEEFSFVENLGEVDEEHGYLPELVIKKDKTEAEFGGGVCQVSTTAFRAAIYSGMEITARRNHAYPVSYYNPQGMDATVYIPRPDLKFINNTPNYILIQTEIKGTELFFRFYGTSDGRKVEIDGPKIIQKNSDGSMKTTFTQKVIDKDNNVILEDIFNSSYDSPSKYPHPEDVLTEKPKDWSKKEWEKYKKEHNLQ